MQLYWNKVSAGYEAMLPKDTEFQQWTDEDGDQYFGTRRSGSAVDHGIQRQVVTGGIVREESYKNGADHGLSRCISASEVHLRLHKEGTQIAFVSYDSKFKETARYGDEIHLFADLKPSDFNPMEKLDKGSFEYKLNHEKFIYDNRNLFGNV